MLHGHRNCFLSRFYAPNSALISESTTVSKDSINLSKPSGYFSYQPGLTFKNSTWYKLCFEYFVRISEQTATFALYIIN